MEFGVSTRLFYDAALDLDQLERIRGLGLGRIEILANRPHFDYHSRRLRQDVARWFRENELPPPSLHLPFEERLERDHVREISVLARESGARQEALDELKRCLELAEHLPLDYVVLHLGVPDQRFHAACFDYAYAAVAQIQAFAGVRVLIENIENEISTLQRIRELVDVAKLERVAVCYDTAHGHATGDGMVFEPESAAPIAALDIRDTADDPGARLWPFEGNIRWPALIEELTLAKFKGPMIFEVEGGDPAKAHETRRRLEDLRAEAENSIDEFRLKYKLPKPRREEEDD